MDVFQGIWNGFSVALVPAKLAACFFGVLVGTAVGVLPGIGPSGSIALLIPLTFYMDATSAIIMLAGIYYGTMYGGSTTSILVNVPGEAQSVITCLDGYQMSRQGRAGPALGISAFGSFIAGTVGVIGLMVIAPPLAEFALKFGPPEIFAMVVLAFTLVGYLASGSMVQSLMMAGIGLLLSTVGMETITAIPRFTFGNVNLQSGIDLVPLVMGLFGISEVLLSLEEAGKEGIDLSRARHAVYYAQTFSLGDYEQSLARIRRPGQRSKTVWYHHLIAEGTVDLKIRQALREKRDVVQAVLEEARAAWAGAEKKEA